METLFFMCISMGLLFEMPVLTWLFAKFGLVTPDLMKRYRKNACVVILVLAAIITPTSDAITLLLVSLPMILLYEISIGIAGKAESRCQNKAVID
jgi:sec-independent protein translocase protein TatC